MAESQETYLVVINLPGPNWSAPLDSIPEAAEHHRQVYQSLIDDGLLISAGRMEGTPMMGLSLFHQGVDEDLVRERLDNDEIVKRGIVILEYRHWNLLSGSLAGVR